MPTLHTVNSSPFQTFALKQCLAILSEKDCLLLIEDAVIASQANHTDFELLKKLADEGRLMILKPDLQARGICNKIGNTCDYSDFVNLVANHKNAIAW